MKRAGTVVGMLFLCAASVGFGSEARMGRTVLQGTNEVSLGCYAAAEDRTACVTVRNAGKGDLHIERVIVTCKCMRVEAYPRTLAPGAAGEVAVTLLGGEMSGPFTRIFYIETDDPDNRNLKIRIRGNAEPGGARDPRTPAVGTP